MELTAIAIVVGLLVNAAVVAYSYGVLNQKVKYLTAQAAKFEKRLNGEEGGYYCPLLGRNVREADIGDGPKQHRGAK